MIRKRIFDLSHTVYTGKPIISGISREIRLKGDYVAVILNTTSTRADISTIFNDHVNHENIYVSLTRPFGLG